MERGWSRDGWNNRSSLVTKSPVLELLSPVASPQLPKKAARLGRLFDSQLNRALGLRRRRPWRGSRATTHAKRARSEAKIFWVSGCRAWTDSGGRKVRVRLTSRPTCRMENSRTCQSLPAVEAAEDFSERGVRHEEEDEQEDDEEGGRLEGEVAGEVHEERRAHHHCVGHVDGREDDEDAVAAERQAVEEDGDDEEEDDENVPGRGGTS